MLFLGPPGSFSETNYELSCLTSGRSRPPCPYQQRVALPRRRRGRGGHLIGCGQVRNATPATQVIQPALEVLDSLLGSRIRSDSLPLRRSHTFGNRRRRLLSGYRRLCLLHHHVRVKSFAGVRSADNSSTHPKHKETLPIPSPAFEGFVSILVDPSKSNSLPAALALRLLPAALPPASRDSRSFDRAIDDQDQEHYMFAGSSRSKRHRFLRVRSVRSSIRGKLGHIPLLCLVGPWPCY